jgi:hypothetical protein
MRWLGPGVLGRSPGIKPGGLIPAGYIAEDHAKQLAAKGMIELDVVIVEEAIVEEAIVEEVVVKEPVEVLSEEPELEDETRSIKIPVGVMEVEVEPGDDKVFGTPDDKIEIKPKKRGRKKKLK